MKQQLLEKSLALIDDPRLNADITEKLHEMGIPSHLLGYQYVRRAIYIVVLYPMIINNITQVLYPSVATYFDTNPAKVERSIRHAIEAGWENVPIEVITKYFGNSINKDRGKPVNSEFIATMADILINKKFKKEK